MKVVLIGPVYPYRGGIAQHTTRLANAFKEAGHELLVISYRRQYPKWLYPGKSDKDPSQQVKKTAVKYLLDPILPWTWVISLRQIRQFTPDMVVIPWWTTFFGLMDIFFSRSLKSGEIPLVYLIHNVMPHERRLLDEQLTRIALAPASGFLTHTERERQNLLALIPTANVRMSPLPIYDDFQESNLTKSESREALGLPLNAILLLFFGIVRPYKGLSVLIDALKNLAAEPDGDCPAVHLIVAGEFWDSRSKYDRQIDANRLTNHISIWDRYIPDDQLPVFFKAADLFVAPYTGGTQSAAAKLALGYRLPVVLSNHISDQILSALEGDGVYISKTGDPQSLAAKLREAIRELDQRKPYQASPHGVGWDALVEQLVLAAQNARPVG